MKSLHIAAVISLSVIILSIIAVILLAVIPHPAGHQDAENDDFGDRIARIALFNGCGREGLASQFTSALRQRGYDVVNGKGDNADSYDFASSVVVDRKGNRRGAERIADDLGISTVIIQIASDPYVIEDYEIILGRDWDTLQLAKEVHQE